MTIRFSPSGALSAFVSVAATTLVAGCSANMDGQEGDGSDLLTGDPAIGSSESAATVVVDPRVYSPSEKYASKTLSQWGGEWFKWTWETPASASPVTKASGTVNLNQRLGNTPIRFIQNPFFSILGNEHFRLGTYQATIPDNAAIYLSGLSCYYFRDPGETTSEAEMRQFVRECNDNYKSVTAEIDGTPVRYNFRAGRIQSPLVSVTMPADNIVNYFHWSTFNYPAGLVTQGVIDDYAMLIKPLSVGPHVVHFRATTTSGDLQDTTYFLHVVAH